MPVEDTEEKNQVCQTKKEIKWVQEETQMQWMLIEEEKKIGHAMCMKNGAIWPKITMIDEKRKDK